MWRKAARFGAVGIEMVVALTIGYFGGTWLDEALGTHPVFLVVGLVGGMGAAVKAVWDIAHKVRREMEEEEDQD